MNLPNGIKFNFLVTGSKSKGYLGMCKETGIIRDGQTPLEVEKKLINSTLAIIDVASKDAKYIPNLYIGLPVKFKVKFYYYLLVVLFKRFMDDFEINFFTRNTSNLALRT